VLGGSLAAIQFRSHEARALRAWGHFLRSCLSAPCTAGGATLSRRAGTEALTQSECLGVARGCGVCDPRLGGPPGSCRVLLCTGQSRVRALNEWQCAREQGTRWRGQRGRESRRDGDLDVTARGLGRVPGSSCALQISCAPKVLQKRLVEWG
jgi:hypothetical protein